MMTLILLRPKVDFVFKQIFGNEKHPNVLISFPKIRLNTKSILGGNKATVINSQPLFYFFLLLYYVLLKYASL